MFNVSGFYFNCLNFSSIHSVSNFLQRKIVSIQLKSNLLLKNKSHDRVVEKIFILSVCVFCVSASFIMFVRRGNWEGRVKQKWNALFSKFPFETTKQPPVQKKLSVNLDGVVHDIDLTQRLNKNEDLKEGRLFLKPFIRRGHGWFELKDRADHVTHYYYNLQSGEVLEKKPQKPLGGVDFSDNHYSTLDCTGQLDWMCNNIIILLSEIENEIEPFNFQDNEVYLNYCKKWGIPKGTILDLWIYTEIFKGAVEVASSCPKIKDEKQKYKDYKSLKNSFKDEKIEVETLVNEWAKKNTSHIIVTDDIKNGGLKTVPAFLDFIHDMRNLLFIIERLGSQKCFFPNELIGAEFPFHNTTHKIVGSVRLNPKYNLEPSKEIKFCHVLIPSIINFSNSTTYGINKSLILEASRT